MFTAVIVIKAIQITGGTPPIRTTKYNRFKGVDMTTAPTSIDNSRSPYAPNLIVDSGGYPEKRLGYRTLATFEQPINGIYYVNIKGETSYIVHGGTKLYKWDGAEETNVIKENIYSNRSVGLVMKEKFWLLTGNEYLVYDGVTVQDVSEIAYVPTTIIARAPTGGGQAYEAVNLLQPKRINKFLADGTTKIYQLDTTNLDADLVTVKINDADKIETTDFTVNREQGIVTFTTAPAAPTITGKDNVFITFSKTVEGYADRIKKCSVMTSYGVGTNDRVFVSGNPSYQSTDWHSELNDPSYVSDLSYSIIGSENTAVMGYAKIGEYLAIVKEDNSQDSTIFLRSAKLDSVDGETRTAAFPLKQGVNSVGAISKHAISSLIDEPLFLSRTGVHAITSNLVTAERTVKNRSYFINAVLCKEPNLENAVAVEWNGMFLVAVNSKCYILDGKQNKSYQSQADGDYTYECYQWNNIPAVCFLENKGNLFFGTADGRICRFNNDIHTMDKYSDDGQPIVCSWSTKADDDGDFTLRKSMPKKGSGLMLKPYTRSSCKISIRTDKDFGNIIKTGTMDIINFDDLDFERFSFNTNDAPQVIPFNKKVKKYITAQIIVTNDALNEGFGILGITKRYSVGSYVK